MSPTTRNLLAASLVVLGVLNAAIYLLVPTAPAPQAPPAPTVSTHVDEARHVVCWLASSTHGLGISCLREAPAPAATGPGVFAP